MTQQGSGSARMEQVRAQLQRNPALIEQMPGDEGDMARAAMNGHDVYVIAQQHGVSEDAVWSVLSNAMQMMTGLPQKPIETGGLGSDTDPGVTGGYGETGFGSIGNEPPMPAPNEPRS